eukprot:1145833-Pelagomonas_calceolata.AAC.1
MYEACCLRQTTSERYGMKVSQSIQTRAQGAKDQQLCGPPPPAPLHAFAAGFGHGNYSSSPVAGYG